MRVLVLRGGRLGLQGRADLCYACLFMRDPIGEFALQGRLGRPHPPIAHGLVLGGAGPDLGAVQGHMPKPHKPGLLAELQDLHEQPLQRFEMALAEVADRAEVRLIQGSDRHEVDPLAAGLGDAPG